MAKQVFFAHFEPIGTAFGQWKIPICLEERPFWQQKWVKNRSKTCFSKSDHGPLVVHKQHIFEPFLVPKQPIFKAF